MSISVSKVSHFYGKQQALKDVSFNIKSGEVVGFLGPNGAGKSTMMKILTGFLPLSYGKVIVSGENVMENSVLFRNKVGYLPENNPLYTDMYVVEYLQFIASLYKLKNKKARIEEMIDCTGLKSEKHKKIDSLSKGYRQRVGLAQALLSNPEVLILDEPTTGLDPNQIVEVRSLIKNLGQSKTILLSTHIMQEVNAICERVIIINAGSIVADAHPDKLELLTFSNEDVIEIEFEKPVIPEKILTIQGIINVEKIENATYIIRAAKEPDIRHSLFHFAVENNLVILSMIKKQQTLEEVFRGLTV